jgi:hypothetical protein
MPSMMMLIIEGLLVLLDAIASLQRLAYLESMGIIKRNDKAIMIAHSNRSNINNPPR